MAQSLQIPVEINLKTNKEDFNLDKLDLMKLCKSFGLKSPPFVHLNVRPTKSSMRRKRKDYSKSNGKDNDNRQFIR